MWKNCGCQWPHSEFYYDNLHKETRGLATLIHVAHIKITGNCRKWFIVYLVGEVLIAEILILYLLYMHQQCCIALHHTPVQCNAIQCEFTNEPNYRKIVKTSSERCWLQNYCIALACNQRILPSKKYFLRFTLWYLPQTL